MIDEQQMIRTLLAEQVRMLGYIQSIVRRPELADDIFQDVCALAVEKRGQIKDEAHLRNCLRTTARLEALTALRMRREDHLVLDPALLDVLDCSWRDEEFSDSSAYGDSLRQCLKLLSKPHQALVNKRFYENCDYGQSEHPADHALDENTDTRWCANGGNMPRWWMADLGKIEPVAGIQLAWEFPDGHYPVRRQIEKSVRRLGLSEGMEDRGVLARKPQAHPAG